MHISHLPTTTTIRVLLPHQFSLPRKSPSSRWWQSILGQKMSTSSNSNPPQLLLLSDLSTPGSSSSSSSSSNLAIPSAVSVEEELADTLQKARIKAPPPKPSPRYADIGINLTDPAFSGIYHGKKCHESDLAHVLSRARTVNCLKMIVTGSDLTESEKAIHLAETHPGILYATVGVHPCNAQKFTTHPTGPSSLLSSLSQLAQAGKSAGRCVAFGEIGLDYDRLFLCPKEIQLQYFDAQLLLATELQLPLFLHSRAASEDFEGVLRKYLDRLPKRGVVHSFTGSVEEMKRLVGLGFDIGINGCSLKTEGNLDVVREIPLDRIQLETDGPWCEIRASHASAKYLLTATPPPPPPPPPLTTTNTLTTTTNKSRSYENNNNNNRKGKEEEEEEEGKATTAKTQAPPPALGPPRLPKAVKKEKWDKDCMIKGRWEPVGITHVAWVVARVKEVSVEELTEAAWRNSIHMFGLGEMDGESEV